MNVWIHALPSPPPAHTKPDLSNKNPLESTWGEKEEEKRGRNPGESEVGRGKIHGKAGKALQEVVLALRKSHFFPPCSTWIFWILPGPAQNPGKNFSAGSFSQRQVSLQVGKEFWEDEEPGEFSSSASRKRRPWISRGNRRRSQRWQNHSQTWKNNTSTPR